MPAPAHSRLITAAARTHLRPLGCVQKGRSRVWLDDQGGAGWLNSSRLRGAKEVI